MSKTTLVHEPETQSTTGYDYGQPNAARSPVSLEEMRQIEITAGWSEEDARILERHGNIFKEHAEQMVNSWRAVIASQPHLAKWFYGPDGKPDEEYKAKIKKRLVQWVTDVCFRPHDQTWLDYQEEIALRHTPAKKKPNRSRPSLVPLRYMIAFGTIVSITARRFFMDSGVKGEELQRLQDAWAKAVQLHITLWARPYAQEGLW